MGDAMNSDFICGFSLGISLTLLFNIEINGGSMNPLSPEQILRNLENGYFMTHQEQSEAAQYIRQLQQENLTLLGKREWVGLTDEERNRFINYTDENFAAGVLWAEAKLKEKNGAL